METKKPTQEQLDDIKRIMDLTTIELIKNMEKSKFRRKKNANRNDESK